MSSPLFRSLLAASLCLAPLGWAAAQDQPQQREDQRERQEQQRPPQQQQRPAQQPQHAPPQQGNTAPQGQRPAGPGGSPQFQRPVQNNAAPPSPQNFQRPVQNNSVRPSPPSGATASPTPPPGQNQFQRVQGPPQNGGAAPQQQFQQRSVQRGGAPTAPQAQQPTTVSRGNFQGNARPANQAAFAQRHAGAAPTQFSRGLFYGRDFAHFTPRETELWRRGGWRHEFHDGRFGWWYAVDGIWYFYDEPVYPYPTFVPDVVYIPEEDYDDDAPVYADEPPEPAPPQYGQPATAYYYFCQDTQTYYPYVTSCDSPWQPVPAAPQ